RVEARGWRHSAHISHAAGASPPLPPPRIWETTQSSAIDEFSLATVPIDLRFNEQPLSSATAFPWERHDMHFLITNWHNVSGRDPNTDKHLSRTVTEPNMLYGMFNTKGKNIGDKHQLGIRIRQDSG